jgi:undecaprenyl-phosphate 4-deoxy-4-formamido-L-arabinose transferase
VQSLDIIIPVYNSEKTIGRIVDQIVSSDLNLIYNVKVILVNDGSTDGSLSVCRKLSFSYEQVLLVDLMRNFGQHSAIFAGLSQSAADFVITMDDDGQHLVSEISTLMSKLNDKTDVVYGIANIEEHGFLRNASSNLFKSMLFRTLGIQNSREISAFRLIRKETLSGIDFTRLSSGILDVVLHWNTSRITFTKVKMQKRNLGKSSYSYPKLIKFALGMLTSYSIRPLRAASLFGLVGFFLSGAFAVSLYVRYLFGDITTPGFATIAILVSMLGSVQLVTLGILGEYLGVIHQRSIGKPIYAIREVV